MSYPNERTDLERILHQGECVYEHANNVNVLPDLGPRCVYSWRGKFAVSHPDLGDSGPYNTLLEALQDNDGDLLCITGGTGSIKCSLLDSPRLIALFEVVADAVEIELNGEWWSYCDEKWTRAPGS